MLERKKMPKVKYSRETILKKTMEIVEKSGLEAINVRDVATELGCSVAPIYTVFGSLEELVRAVKEAYVDLIITYTTQNYSEDSFLNIGIGAVRFALDYPRVYRTFCMENIVSPEEEMCEGKLLETLYQHPLKEWLSQDELKDMMLKMDIFTQGLCMQITMGNKGKLTLEKCEKLLENMGQEMIIGILVKKGLYEKFVKEQMMGDGIRS